MDTIQIGPRVYAHRRDISLVIALSDLPDKSVLIKAREECRLLYFHSGSS